MLRMRELFLGLKPEAQFLLRPRPDVKVVFGLEIKTGLNGEITGIRADDISNEPVRRFYWETITTNDLQQFDLLLWAFPLRMKDKYRDQVYRTVYRRVQYPSRILRTSSVIVVEVIDSDDERLIPESAWSVEDIKKAVEKIEQASPFALAAEWADLCRYVWDQIWSDNGLVCQELEIASYLAMVDFSDLRGSLERYFDYGLKLAMLNETVKERMAKLEADHKIWNRLLLDYLNFEIKFTLGYAYSDSLETVERLIFNNKPMDPIYHILAGNRMPRRIKALQRYIEETNRYNIGEMFSYARDKPLLLFCAFDKKI